MSDKKIFNINAGNQPNSGIAVTVVGERGRKELPPGMKGGENLKPDRHYEHNKGRFSYADECRLAGKAETEEEI